MVEGILDGILKCGKHDAPMILIKGSYICVLEYLDDLVGNLKVKTVKGGDLLFSNNVSIPLICPCCGEKDTAKSFEDQIKGLYLVSLGYQPKKDNFDEAILLYFSDNIENEPHPGDFIAIHMDSVRKIKKENKNN
jgi:hypothetical protein